MAGARIALSLKNPSFCARNHITSASCVFAHAYDDPPEGSAHKQFASNSSGRYSKCIVSKCCQRPPQMKPSASKASTIACGMEFFQVKEPSAFFSHSQ